MVINADIQNNILNSIGRTRILSYVYTRKTCHGRIIYERKPHYVIAYSWNRKTQEVCNSVECKVCCTTYCLGLCTKHPNAECDDVDRNSKKNKATKYWQCKLESINKFVKTYKMRLITRTVLIMVIISIVVGIIRIVPDHVLRKCCIGFQECRPNHIETLFGFTCYIRCFTQSKLGSHACRTCECAVIKRS